MLDSKTIGPVISLIILTISIGIIIINGGE